MFAYNIYWGSGKSMLLYPCSNGQQDITGRFHKGHPGENNCTLGFVNVLDPSGQHLNLDVGREILEKILV